MNRLQLQTILLFFIMSISIDYLLASDTVRIEYPANFRNWVHVKSVLINEKHPLFDDFGGIHHIYANPKALKALKEKTAYPRGSMFVFDLKFSSPFEGGIEEGKRRRIDVMQRDQQKFMDTGGWGFGSFSGDSQNLVKQNVSEKCFSCHLAQKENHYVFSKYKF